MGKDKTNRTVKTLLLCKINPQVDADQLLYNKLQGIYKGERGTGKGFAAIGKVDGVSIYDTRESQGQPADLPNNWLGCVYRDRTAIIHKSNAGIRYHPIHLVANETYNSRDDIDECCVVITLIYGVNFKNAGLGVSGEEKESQFICYENVIKRWLNQYGQKIKMAEFVKEFEVYNAINICDVVVIHYTKNLKRSMEVMNSFGEEMIARKTLSLICFPMEWLKSNAQNKLKMVKRVSDKNECYSLRMEGSIRSQQNFDILYKHLNSEFGHAIHSDIVFGQLDFSWQFADCSSQECDLLFNFLFNNYPNIELACWELHTEFLKPYAPKDVALEKCSTDPTNILKMLYEDYANLSSAKIKKLPWYNIFYELLTVNANIDSDPVLHGPGYLIYRFIKILYGYLSKYAHSSSKGEGRAYEKVLTDNRIANAVQDLSNLTDYILRNDDVIFHGFGTCSALYNTLPECALDFYHSMLLCIVEYLYKCDIYYNAVDKNMKYDTVKNKAEGYCYDFLLLPNDGNIVNVDELFHVEGELQQNPLGLSLPMQQVYLVGFSVKDAYDPFVFFTKLVHECFHYLGDVCRLRDNRSKYLCDFAAQLIVGEFFYNLPLNIMAQIKKDLTSILYSHFKGKCNPNTILSLRLLSDGLWSCFSEESLSKIRAITKHSRYLYEVYGPVQLLSEDMNYFIINYFREGYADLMMILLLQLTPEEYYRLFEFKKIVNTATEGTETEDDTGKEIMDMLRISLVSSVLSRKFKKSGNKKKRKWRGIGNKTVAKLNLMNCYSTYMLKYYKALKKDNSETPDPESLRDGKDRICPVPCMIYVRKYLEEVFDAFFQKYERTPENEDLWHALFGNASKELLAKIRSRFKTFFIDDNLFNDEFFEVIYEDHEKVRDMLKEKANNKR